MPIYYESRLVQVDLDETGRQLLDELDEDHHSPVADEHQIFAFLEQQSVFAQGSVTIDHIAIARAVKTFPEARSPDMS